MPELADVEGFRRVFARHAVGQPIRRVHTLDAAILRNTSPQGLGRALKGRRFREPHRHGKWLLAPAGDGRTVLFHFGMTGGLRWRDGEEPGRHVRVVFELRGGALDYHAQRKIGGVWLARDEGKVEEVTGPLGPDAASLGRDDFLALLEEKKGGVKSALMDQSLLAGLGNELSDEILWRAGVDPRAKVGSLDEGALRKLHASMCDVLKRSLRKGRIPMDPAWLRNAREQDDPRCPRCGAALRHGKVAGRTSYWCPRCQGSR